MTRGASWTLSAPIPRPMRRRDRPAPRARGCGASSCAPDPLKIRTTLPKKQDHFRESSQKRDISLKSVQDRACIVPRESRSRVYSVIALLKYSHFGLLPQKFRFDAFMGFVIIFNSIAIGVEAQFALEGKDMYFFQVLEVLFSVAYTVGETPETNCLNMQMCRSQKV